MIIVGILFTFFRFILCYDDINGINVSIKFDIFGMQIYYVIQTKYAWNMVCSHFLLTRAAVDHNVMYLGGIKP